MKTSWTVPFCGCCNCNSGHGNSFTDLNLSFIVLSKDPVQYKENEWSALFYTYR